MRGIEYRNGCIFFYGNPAGYVDKDAAIMDTLFQNDELAKWLAKNNLTVRWADGVYERLANGVPDISDGNAVPLKNCRIWQLKPGSETWRDIASFGKALPEPDIQDYTVVYDGQLDTNDLEAIYDRFHEKCPQGFHGHPLSVSDIVELYSAEGSSFYYLDRTHFREVEFTTDDGPAQGMTMSL